MIGGKELHQEQREWVVVMADGDYCALPFEFRQRFKSEKATYPGEHNEFYEKDLQYRELYKTYRAAKKDFEQRAFELRHGKVTK